MDITERINILTQSAELVQKNGSLSLNEAVIIKQCIDALNNGQYTKEYFDNLINVAKIGQKNGVFTLRDAHFIYLATENIDEFIGNEVTTEE